MKAAISVHFAEIALKGRNRSEFEKALVANIRNSLSDSIERIERTESRLLVFPKDPDAALQGLQKIFGIAWFSPSFITSRDIKEMKSFIVERSEGFKGKRIRVEATRSDKSFHLTSPEINREIGEALADSGHQIDLKKPERKVFIAILRDKAIISFERINGLGGLPVGTAGPVLSLLSGGIDSPVASWLMMKRGCSVDYIHVHSSPSSDEVRTSKIPKVVEKLREFHPGKCRLFIAPYSEFYKKSIGINPKAELVVFRRFILRLADSLAEKYGYLGIATGDNIGQVASQTLENLRATNEAAGNPVYRPLLTYDKKEIIDLAKRIGTYGLSVEEYKDCCSLVAMRHPSTKVKMETAKEIEEKIGMDGIVERTLHQIEVLEI